MKIQLPLTLVAYVGANLKSIGDQIELIEKTHEGLKKIQAKKDASTAKRFNKPIEEVIKDRVEASEAKKKKFFDAIFNSQFIKNKRVTVTKTSTSLDIDVNEELIKDLVDIYFNMYRKVLPHLADLFTVAENHLEACKEFTTKWSDVEFTFNGWTFVQENKSPESICLNDGKLINAHNWTATDGKHTFKVYSHMLKFVHSSPKGIKDFPESLNKAARELLNSYYNIKE